MSGTGSTGGGGTTGGGGGTATNDPFGEFDTAIAAPIASNSMASAAQIATITTLITRPEQIQFVVLSADIGSSAQTSYPQGGPTTAHTWNFIAETIRRVCTVRQFCMYYAAFYYSAARSRNRPPANWARKGFTTVTQYAAFDFFNGATMRGGYAPAGFAPATPTQAELNAAQANSRVLIMRSRAENANTNLVELTGGRDVNRPLLALPAPPS